MKGKRRTQEVLRFVLATQRIGGRFHQSEISLVVHHVARARSSRFSVSADK